MTRLGVATVLCVLVVLLSLACVDSQSSARLVGDRAEAGEGRLQVPWHCSRSECPIWFNVCDDSFDNTSAQLACYELGFGCNGFATRCSTTMTQCRRNVRCHGSETSFAACIPYESSHFWSHPHGYAVCVTCITPAETTTTEATTTTTTTTTEPTTTTPPTANSVFMIDVDDEIMELYVDGVLIPNELLPRRQTRCCADAVTVSTKFQLVAVSAFDSDGSYGLIASFSYNNFVTDFSWKCTDASNKPNGWMNLEFDDSTWPYASAAKQNTTIGGINPAAKWIWTSAYNRQIVCRGRHRSFFEHMLDQMIIVDYDEDYSTVVNPATIWSNTDCGRSKYADAGRIEQDTHALVVGGHAAREHEYPWQVSVRQKLDTFPPSERHICGGSIINERWILTAAHCVENKYGQRLPKSAIVVVVGNHQHSAPSSVRQTFNVATVVLHTFSWRTFNNDIALFKLSRAIVFSENVQPVCPPNTTEHYTGWKAYVSGWGRLNYTDYDYPDILQHTSIDITSNRYCQSRWRREPRNIAASMVCASSAEGRRVDVCKGDSGGPLTVTDDAGSFHLVGIVSFGNFCSTNMPSVYTRISSHLEWISNTISD